MYVAMQVSVISASNAVYMHVPADVQADRLSLWSPVISAATHTCMLVDMQASVTDAV
jgi:hypothetical protein